MIHSKTHQTSVDKSNQLFLNPSECSDELSGNNIEKAKIKLLEPKGQRALRSLAFQLLYAIDRSDYEMSLSDLLELYNEFYGLTVSSECFSLEIVKGVIQTRKEIYEVLKPMLENWHFSRLSCTTRLLLFMSVWELKFFGKHPEKTIVDEYIELAKAYGEKDCYKFINGILDKLIKKAL